MSKYERYKPSGIDWIGEMPEHWERRRLKDYAEIIMGQSPDSNSYNDEEIGLPFYQGKVDFGEFNPVPRIWCNEPTKISDADDILISVRAPVGELNIVNEKCCIGRGLTAVRIKKGEKRYAYYQFQIINEELKINVTGSTFEAVSSNDISILKYIFPPKSEQLIIADYLDEQTRKIDQLISNKKAQAEKLKELRQIEINNAVTKGLPAEASAKAGLNPDAGMKESGIAWLGERPGHWEVKRIKNIADVKYGLGQPPEEKEDGLPLIRATNVERGKINDKDLIFVDPADIPYDRDPVLSENDIIVVRSGAYTADSAIIPKKYEGAIAGYDMVMRVNKSLPLFISYCLLSNYLLVNQLFLERLRAAQPHLNKEELDRALILVPPAAEQIQIANYLKDRTSLIDKLIKNIEAQIEKLQELRKIKIYEAVTGKIKVA